MKYLGGLVLVSVVILAAYFVLANEVSGTRIAVFGGIGLFVGIAMMLCDRITGVTVPGVGEITTAVEKATSGAEEVERIQKEVEKHRDAIALIVRDANAARDDLDKVRSLSNDAKLQSDELSKVLKQAQEKLEDLRSSGDFGLLLTKASTDDRPAFDSLLKIARDKNHRFCGTANQALITIITDPQVTGLLTYSIDWRKEHNLDPAKATVGQFADAYKREVSIRQPAVLTAIWEQERFPKSQRLDALYEVIKTTGSLRCLHHACDLMNGESKVGMNILAYEEYLKWWEKNRPLYKEKEKAQPTDSSEKQ